MSFKKFQKICNEHFKKQQASLIKQGYTKGAVLRLDNSIFGVSPGGLYLTIEAENIDCPMVLASDPVPRVKLLSMSEKRFIYRSLELPVQVISKGEYTSDFFVKTDLEARWDSMSEEAKDRFCIVHGD